jgi:mannose/fructose-specific phosphotransferase system component IIA
LLVDETGEDKGYILDSLTKLHGKRLNVELINMTRDQNMWRYMTSNINFANATDDNELLK